MDEQIVEENPTNPTEITVENQTPEEKETPIQKTEHTDTEKRLYTRANKAEEEAKAAKAELKRVQDELARAKLPISDVDAILEVQTATNGLDTDEVSELKLRANALGTSLSKAREDKNYQLWQRGHREEIIKNKALAPSTNQDEVDRPKTLEEKLLKAQTQEEKEKILDAYGINPMKARNY